MSSLLDDLLDVSRITRGSFALKRAPADLKSLLDAAVEAAQEAIDLKRHTLRLEIPEVPVIVNVDSVRLTQVLTNLLTNAAKYTPAGGLIVAGGRLEPREVCLYVRDNGIGLTRGQTRDIFNMFIRVAADERTEGGLGIGLALAKGLMELHGGRIEARSDGLGHGSEFVVSLPGSSTVTGPGVQQRGDHASAASARRVLLVDDNRDAAETLAMVLQSQGHQVAVAYSGQEALEAAAHEHPQVAILDIGMPHMNGFELAQRLRNEPWGKEMTLIALTGWGQVDDKQRARSAGFDHHCTKPVDPVEIERLFDRPH
jgi:CheY-like chemotaxis protein/anti-sigma regulatory factor (Ser/Thr protein kinase)